MNEPTDVSVSRYMMFISWQEQQLSALEEDHAVAPTDEHRKAIEHAIEVTKMNRHGLQQILDILFAS